ncbi:MAG: translation initiation factor IF-2 [Candidatus Methanomethyliaceae archaeon]|nr:translation initiation factor IF-2 [Candidatus Methanomethyliaceae archaeon]
MGASFLPMDVIVKYCSSVIKGFEAKLKVPGILFIDTPGHEVFSNLRFRGGSVSDIAILVIDIQKGVERQTEECIEILKSRKTPFVVAANKIDRIPGWKSHPNKSFIESYKLQESYVRERLDDMINRVIGELARYGFSSDRYDRIRDFTRTIAIVPTSAVTGEGIPELLALICGLAQHYLTNRLSTTEGPGEGVVLETKEDPGLGKTLDVILFNGILKKGDTIVVGGLNGPIVTKIRAILLPKPLNEIRDPEDKFISTEKIFAAAGVKIVAPGLEDAISGAPVIVANDEASIELAKNKISEEMAELRFYSDINGVVVKADTLGSLEALVKFLRNSGIPVRISDIGPIGKKDIIEASIVKRKKPEFGAILGFNINVTHEASIEAKNRGIPIFVSNVIYHIVDDFKAWYTKTIEEMRSREFSQIILPGVLRILPGYVFRRSSPPIFGIEVLLGYIKPGYPLMKENGEIIGEILQIQDRGINIEMAKRGDKVAISVKGDFIVGRQVKEGEILYVAVGENDIFLLKEKFKDRLSQEELELLDKILKIYLDRELKNIE